MIKIQEMIDDGKCYEQGRTLRRAERVTCPFCGGHKIKKRSYHSHQPGRQRYQCRKCKKRLDDLSKTPFEGHPHPLKVWILSRYFMGFDLANHQIAQELDLNKDDVQAMTAYLRQRVYDRQSPAQREGAAEFDEVYLVAGHKGYPSLVQELGRGGRRGAHGTRLKGARGRGTLEAEKPPLFGMIQRSGELIIPTNLDQRPVVLYRWLS